MFVVPGSWELASLVCKLLLYFGAASIAGGSLCLGLYSDGHRQSVYTLLVYIMVGAMLGFQAVLANFFIQVGLVNDGGLAAMFDWNMASLLLDTQLGDVTFFRLAGFVAVILSSGFFLRKARQLNQAPGRTFYRSVLILHGAALLAVAFSFTLAGHVSVLSITARVAIILHFSAFACWIGSLFPLLLLTRSADLEFMQWAMRRFGNNAMAIVLVLTVAGVLMLIEVIASPGELVTTAYGLSLLLKLVLVLTIVGIAGLNKLLLVPAISSESSGAKLGKSIRVESVVATLILLLTAYSSTIIGPAGH
ncbi:MAG TPA: hypothetical protein DCM64_06195 [Gammaproteobacteria bacterium]|jgi:putative copper resistance protein D|nr:CopD family protein [Gammaproteobacteria bacterium]MDP6732491.1 CopD family protein [Gammaproteobacteria bacterium]HAJ76029.1 hypothetical protein [Gammaproteobacteria bacterium]